MNLDPDRIRICFLASQLGLGGAERQLYYLVSNLDVAHFDIAVVNLSDGRGEYWEDSLRDLGIEIYNLRNPNRISRALSLRSYIRTWQANIVHSFHYHINGYAVLASWPNLYTLGSIQGEATDNRLNQVPPYWKRVCLYGVNVLVCNSITANKQLAESYPDLADVKVIQNGIFIPSDEDLADFVVQSKLDFGKVKDKLIIGYVGRLSHVKNPIFLLEMFARLLAEHPRLQLIIVGEGPLRRELEDFCKDTKIDQHVEFLGHQPQAERIIPVFDLLCLTSLSEGMPNVLMEAAAACVPVVSSDVGGVSEIVVHGETGFLFPPGDKTRAIEYVNKLLTDSNLRKKMGTMAQKKMREKYSVDRMVSQFDDLYKNLVQREKRKLRRRDRMFRKG